MSATLYELSVKVFIRDLRILEKLLAKGVAFTKEEGKAKGVTEESLSTGRLIADMGDLVYQIQRVSDTAKGVAVRVGKIEPVALKDEEKTFEDMNRRIDATIKVLESVDMSKFNASADAPVVMTTRSGDISFTAKSYLLEWAVPNFYFHFVTAYDILRMKGVDVGKMDYLGRR